MDTIRFAEACARVIGLDYERKSVGLLAEKTVHATLKEYFESDHAFHEIKVGTHFADICKGEHITEIQTRSLGNLRKKLDAFLPNYTVDVVYPIPFVKYLSWMDPVTGEILSRHKSPKKGTFFDAGREIWALSSYLGHPHLRIHLMLIDMEEYRLQNGWSRDGKKGSERYDRIPIALKDEMVLTDGASYDKLFPRDLVGDFTAKEFRKATKTGERVSVSLLSVLVRMGIVLKCGQKGRAFLYRHV